MASSVKITRRVEFDAGHRIPDHKSKCRNMHGHRYTLECTIEGSVQDDRSGSESGMIQDFGDLKLIMMQEIGEPWDHAFLVHEDDEACMAALALLSGNMSSGHKTVFLDRVPTVENLVVLAAIAIGDHMNRYDRVDRYDALKLVHVRLYETPNCWADWYDNGDE